MVAPAVKTRHAEDSIATAGAVGKGPENVTTSLIVTPRWQVPKENTGCDERRSIKSYLDDDSSDDEIKYFDVSKYPAANHDYRAVCPVGGHTSGDKEEPKKQTSGGWKRVRNGITLDSGCEVDIMPKDKLPQFTLKPTTGERKGKKMSAANGTPILEVGEREVKFMTETGKEVTWPFIAGDVNKMLKSVATTCDLDYYVIFTKRGGHIVHEQTHESMPFCRVGNTYAMDAWVRDTDFTRQSTKP